MKSARNPLSKKLRVVRRITSDVQCCDDNLSTASDVGMNQESEHAATVISSETAISQSATEVSGSQSADVPLGSQTLSEEGSKGISSFQLEFLKMLSQEKCSSTLGDGQKQQKVDDNALCEGAAVGSLSLMESCTPDITPPVLSLPDPLTDIGIYPQRPPVLEPSNVAFDDRSSATVRTVSDAVGADISVIDEQTQPVKMSGGRGSELQREARSTEISSAGLVSSPVTAVASCITDPTMQTVSSNTAPSLTVSTSAVAAANAQLQQRANTSTAVPQLNSACRVSSLARFRPTISVSTLLPLTTDSYTPPSARPMAPSRPHHWPRDQI